MIPTIEDRRARRPVAVRAVSIVLSGLVAAILAVAPVAAQTHAGAAAAKRTGKSEPAAVTKAAARSRTAPAAAVSAKPSLVQTYGDWGVYVSQGAKSKICYALAQPKDRSPAGLKRDQAYVFISNRPGESVRNEVSIIMGTALKDGADGGRAEIGSARFDLVAKGQNAFVKNAAEEGQFVDTLKRRGSRMVIKLSTAKGQNVSDTYSLSGVSPALDRVAKECP